MLFLHVVHSSMWCTSQCRAAEIWRKCVLSDVFARKTADFGHGICISYTYKFGCFVWLRKRISNKFGHELSSGWECIKPSNIFRLRPFPNKNMVNARKADWIFVSCIYNWNFYMDICLSIFILPQWNAKCLSIVSQAPTPLSKKKQMLKAA